MRGTSRATQRWTMRSPRSASECSTLSATGAFSAIDLSGMSRGPSIS